MLVSERWRPRIHERVVIKATERVATVLDERDDDRYVVELERRAGALGPENGRREVRSGDELRPCGDG